MPSSSWISGPNAPPRGHRFAASSSVSIVPGSHSRSGFEMTIQPYRSSSSATPRLQPVPYPTFSPISSRCTFARFAAFWGAPSVDTVSATTTWTSRSVAFSSVSRNRSRVSPEK